MTMFCSKCRKEQNFENWYIDDNVYHKNCTNCGLNLSINKKEAKSALIANGTKVKLKKDGKTGIIDGNDFENSNNFKSINYYFCDDKFTNKKIWSNHYEMLLKKDFDIID